MKYEDKTIPTKEFKEMLNDEHLILVKQNTKRYWIFRTLKGEDLIIHVSPSTKYGFYDVMTITIDEWLGNFKSESRKKALEELSTAKYIAAKRKEKLQSLLN